MSTFTTWARDEGRGLVSDLNGLLVSVVDGKKAVIAKTMTPDQFVGWLATLQASLIATRTRADDLTRNLETALGNRELPHFDAPVIDRKQLAAGEGVSAEQKVLHFIPAEKL